MFLVCVAMFLYNVYILIRAILSIYYNNLATKKTKFNEKILIQRNNVSMYISLSQVKILPF